MAKKWINVEVDDKVSDEDLETYVKFLKGVESVKVHDEGEHKEYHNEVLERVGRKLWEVRDRNNPGVIDDIVEDICEAIEKDLSNTPVTGRYAVLTPKKDGDIFEAEAVHGSPDICVWVSGEADVGSLSDTFERMTGVQTVETF